MHDGRTRKVELVEPGRAHDFLLRNRAVLTVTSGPAAGMEFSLEGMRSIAGRSEKAEIMIDDASVSAEHAAFELGHEGFGVRDIASTNGVRVNGKEITSQVLEHGDRIELGEVEMQYVTEERPHGPRVWSVEEDEA